MRSRGDDVSSALRSQQQLSTHGAHQVEWKQRQQQHGRRGTRRLRRRRGRHRHRHRPHRHLRRLHHSIDSTCPKVKQR